MRVVVALIENRDQTKILMQRRPAGKAYGGMWEMPGGKQAEGEIDEETLRREMWEELGVAIEIRDHVARLSLDLVHGPVALTLYQVRIVGDGVPQLKEAEVMGWFALDEIPTPRTPATDPFLAAYRAFRRME